MEWKAEFLIQSEGGFRDLIKIERDTAICENCFENQWLQYLPKACPVSRK